ncbi:uncharacterized protein LOC106657800 [Trichogramma pretiosum]|uniref:uncharacterized protein LOC106657800 n=1 Tax=Trichogramma pretiosum TaxID=7493 RepID=UPI0006C95864|nr:uncharacterized protein LOC106657800 [Trichogramma pretiosum]
MARAPSQQLRFSWFGIIALGTLLVIATPNPAAVRKAERERCNKTVEIYEDVSSPALTAETLGKPLTCWYRFRAFRGAPRDWILRVRFKRFKVGTLLNATTCLGGYLQITDGNTKTEVNNRKELGVFCGESEQPQTFISETSFVRVLFHTDNFTDQTYFSFDSRAEQQFEVYLRYGQHPELYPNRRGEVVAGTYCERSFRDCRLQTCYVQSPAYPGVYPRALHCKYRLNTRLPFIKLYIENEEFNIDGQRCENIMTCPMRPISSGAEHCPYDYLRIYDGLDETAPVIGTFCGMGKFPYSIIGTGRDLFVEFVSSAAGPLLNTGFHFNVGNWPGHVDTASAKNGSCDWVLSSESLAAREEGIFLSVAHWYPPGTSCSYLLKARPGEVARLYFPSFRVNRVESPIQPYTGDCAESLTLYDAAWADDARIIKTFCDTFSRPMEKHDFVSTGPALFVRFESRTGSYSGSSLYYWAHYDFFNATRFGEPVPSSECDEIFAAGRAQRTGRFRSPPNTLLYKRPGEPPRDLDCAYTFLAERRLYARVELTLHALALRDQPHWCPSFSGNCAFVQQQHQQQQHQTGAASSSSASPATSSSSSSSGGGDRLTLRELGNNNNVGICRCGRLEAPIKLLGERLELRLHLDGAHAAAAYFKQPAALFEASWEFVHGPLCGPASLGPRADGELEFPHYEALLGRLGAATANEPLRCVWELRLSPERDLWLQLVHSKFASRSCEDGRLELYLPAAGGGGFQAKPHLVVCGENVSYVRDLPVLSAAQLMPPEPGRPPALRLQFVGSMALARAEFKLAWTELYHLPRDAQGNLAHQRLEDCAFQCPGGAGCIPRRLLCNGVVNCPGPTGGANRSEPDDEAPETCGGSATPQAPDSGHAADRPSAARGFFKELMLLPFGQPGWTGAALAAALAALLCLCCTCRMCRKRAASARDIHVSY